MTRVYGTWVDDNGVCHYASGTPQVQTLFHRKRGEWDTNVFCGNYINVAPGEPEAVVTCFRCLAKLFRPFNPYDILRGKTADMTVIDETQDVDLAFVTLPATRS